jgi:N-acetylmuramoyl-L-alanine amidase
MNAYPLSQYKGLQVWYSKNDPASKSIADGIQETVQSMLQPENNRQTKAASSAIYLLHHIQSPAVLVECGFLSNEEEAARLTTEEYQERLALCLFLAIAEAAHTPNG